MTATPPVDDAWLTRNLGIAPPGPESPPSTGTRSPTPADEQDLMRELIDFDSDGPEGRAFLARAPLAYGLSKFVPIPWPDGLAPTPGTRPTGTKLPKCDVLIVTWTMDEGHALSRVLTPGFDSRDDWVPYTRNFAEISARMRPGCPAINAGRLGTYWRGKIGTKRVTFFKSDSHMSQDGAQLPNADVWQQIIEDSRPRWVITTGTGGGIGTAFEVGDVIVSRFVTFDCHKTFKQLDGQTYASPTTIPAGRFTEATALFAPNAGFLPKDNPRPPSIIVSQDRPTGILTTDFFGFDDSKDTYGLQGKGDLSEMGDAVLGLVCQRIGAKAPPYAIVRNVSDPQIESGTKTLLEEGALAAAIYKGFGRWSTVCSAIACWAIVAALP
jgi:nucleoside phosphorylase